jgi:hypothetical protein
MKKIYSSKETIGVADEREKKLIYSPVPSVFEDERGVKLARENSSIASSCLILRKQGPKVAKHMHGQQQELISMLHFALPSCATHVQVQSLAIDLKQVLRLSPQLWRRHGCMRSEEPPALAARNVHVQRLDASSQFAVFAWSYLNHELVNGLSGGGRAASNASEVRLKVMKAARLRTKALQVGYD